MVNLHVETVHSHRVVLAQGCGILGPLVTRVLETNLALASCASEN